MEKSAGLCGRREGLWLCTGQMGTCKEALLIINETIRRSGKYLSLKRIQSQVGAASGQLGVGSVVNCFWIKMSKRTKLTLKVLITREFKLRKWRHFTISKWRSCFAGKFALNSCSLLTCEHFYFQDIDRSSHCMDQMNPWRH